jgi:hypothetical protein
MLLVVSVVVVLASGDDVENKWATTGLQGTLEEEE